jgi:hypothetical protein
LFYSVIILNFAAIKQIEDMTTVQLNAEIYRELSIIANDEGMLKKALNALRRITTSSTRVPKSKATDMQIDWDKLPELPKSFKELQGMGHVTQEDIANDERLAYILSK